MRVGIKDVARAAGVSPTTVSDALNNKGRLSDATRKHVAEVAARLEYRPSGPARTLATGKANLLALKISEVKGLAIGVTEVEYFLELMVGAMTEALKHGYSLAPTPSRTATDPWYELSFAGAIVVDPVGNDPAVVELRKRGVPVVTTGRDPAALDGGFWVDNDHVVGVRAMLRHLERAGAGRIALLTAPPVNSYSMDAIAAYRQWSEERELEPTVAIAHGVLTEGGGYTAALELLSSADPPEAIYATLDTLALGALLAAQSVGLEVPGNFLVAGGTDSGAARTAQPALTSLNLAPRRIGEAAVRMLMSLIEGRQPAESHVLIATRVNARASTRRVLASA